MAWFAVEEGGTLVGFAEGERGKQPGGYDHPRFTLTKLSRAPTADDEFHDGKLRKRADAAERRAASRAPGQRIAALEADVATLKEQVAALLAARP